ncbi:MAG: hypothetical protein LBB08_01745 [Rickettsiales bacterium]|jgi:hypothetical protein|nr:hypothetical protein [Rickettsiales bacterium]
MRGLSLLFLSAAVSFAVPAAADDPPVIATKKYVDSGLATRIKNTVFDSFKTSAESAIGGKQDKITATGAVNLLTAPSVAGGQPGTKPIGDFAPSSITTTAPVASANQDPGSTETITDKIQRIINNIKDIYTKTPDDNMIPGVPVKTGEYVNGRPVYIIYVEKIGNFEIAVGQRYEFYTEVQADYILSMDGSVLMSNWGTTRLPAIFNASSLQPPFNYFGRFNLVGRQLNYIINNAQTTAVTVTEIKLFIKYA